MNHADAETARLQNMTLALLEAVATLKKLEAIIDEISASMQRITQHLHDDNRLQQTRQEIKQW